MRRVSSLISLCGLHVLIWDDTLRTCIKPLFHFYPDNEAQCSPDRNCAWKHFASTSAIKILREPMMLLTADANISLYNLLRCKIVSNVL